MSMSVCGCSVGRGGGRSPTNALSQQGVSNPRGWGGRRSQSGLEHFQVTNTGVGGEMSQKKKKSEQQKEQQTFVQSVTYFLSV